MAFNNDLDVFFTPKRLSHDYDLGALSSAYQNLLEGCLFRMPGQLTVFTQIDPARMIAFLARFQRDAFGVHFFEKKLDELSARNVLAAEVAEEIRQAFSGVSVRIHSPSPRKTRIAAAFSLWMSACCPFYLTSARIPDVPPALIRTISGRVNFMIATAFLSKFGKINVGDGDDAKERLDRIFYDLTFRELNLSSLELFYCSILRARSGSVEPVD